VAIIELRRSAYDFPKFPFTGRKSVKEGGDSMFVENYRIENAQSLMAGGDATPIPYPKLSEQDWRAWRAFLPVRSRTFDKKAARNLSPESLRLSEGMPYGVTTEIQKASDYFDKVEVWRKRAVDKDPIAVGLLGSERYLVARWGMDQLIPFNTIKRSMPLIFAWNYATHPLSLIAASVGLSYFVWGVLL
jgi:hypothetical protein